MVEYLVQSYYIVFSENTKFKEWGLQIKDNTGSQTYTDFFFST